MGPFATADSGASESEADKGRDYLTAVTRSFRAGSAHCQRVLCRSSHQQGGFQVDAEYWGNAVREHLASTVPRKSYSTLLPLSGVFRYSSTETLPIAVPRIIRNSKKLQSQ